MDCDFGRWTRPELGEVEAMAIISAIGRPRARWGFRDAEGSQQWLASRFDDGPMGCDRVTVRMDALLDLGPEGAARVAFADDELELVDRATYRALTEVKDETRFVARYGIDRTRMAHLRTAFLFERALKYALGSAEDLSVRERVDAMMETGRALRASRPAIYDGPGNLARCPELNLMADAVEFASGRQPHYFGGDLAAARNAFEVDRASWGSKPSLDR